MSDINMVATVGRLTKDPELKSTQSGGSVCSFTLASNKTWKTEQGEKKERVTFVRCSAWGSVGTVISTHCKKGMRIGITGELQSHEWEEEGKKRQALDVKVENFQFLDAKKETHNDDDIPL